MKSRHVSVGGSGCRGNGNGREKFIALLEVRDKVSPITAAVEGMGAAARTRLLDRRKSDRGFSVETTCGGEIMDALAIYESVVSNKTGYGQSDENRVQE